MLSSHPELARAVPHLGAFVVVQRDWNGWRTATVPVEDLEGVHWLQPHGAPRPLIHAYIPCSHIRAEELQHDCDGVSAPHRMLVCVLKCHTSAKVFADLADRARRAQVTAGQQSAHLRP